MSRARFVMQLSAVMALAALVSWPEPRRVSPTDVWGVAPPRASGSLRQSYDPRRAEGQSDGRRAQIGFGTASYALAPAAPGARSLDERLTRNVYENRRSLSPELLALGARLNAIVGYARTSANEDIPFAQVRLRNVRTGEVEARAVSDQSGRFLFLDIRPTAGYAVELIGPDGKVMAASAFLSIATGDLRQTTLFVPVGGPTGTLSAAAAGAPQIIETAIDTGVSRVAQPERAVSPER